MTQMIIGSLVAWALYAGWRWNTLHTENVELRSEVASLRRKLAKFGR